MEAGAFMAGNSARCVPERARNDTGDVAPSTRTIE